MGKRLAILSALGAFTALAVACDAQPSRETVATSQSPIENGQPINNAGQTVSYQFPRSTVLIQFSPTDSSGAFVGSVTPSHPGGGNCTGTILDTGYASGFAKILTAAHCVDGTFTAYVYVYPIGQAGQQPPLPNIPWQWKNQGGPVPVFVTGTVGNSPGYAAYKRPGVTCYGEQGCPDPTKDCAVDGSEGWPDAMTSTCLSDNGVYADLAVLTLPGPLPAASSSTYPPYHAIWLPNVPPPTGPRAQAGLLGSLLPPAVWDVGAGFVHWFAAGCPDTPDATPPAVANADEQMNWVSIAQSPNTSTVPGQLILPKVNTNPGDSGGPLYQYDPYYLANEDVFTTVTTFGSVPLFGIPYSLNQVGVNSAVNCGDQISIYTDIYQVDNYAWLTQMPNNAAVANDVTTQGALQAPGP